MLQNLMMVKEDQIQWVARRVNKNAMFLYFVYLNILIVYIIVGLIAYNGLMVNNKMNKKINFLISHHPSIAKLNHFSKRLPVSLSSNNFFIDSVFPKTFLLELTSSDRNIHQPSRHYLHLNTFPFSTSQPPANINHSTTQLTKTKNYGDL